MRVSLKQALTPKAFEHWGRNIGVCNRVKIQTLQWGAKYPVRGISYIIPGYSPSLESAILRIENKIKTHQEGPIKNEKAELFRAMLRATPEAVTITDLEGNIIECSQATLELHGFHQKKN